MNIVIITRGRVGKVRTLEWIPADWRGRTFICCPPEEVTQHRWPQIIPEPFPMNYSQKFHWLVHNEYASLGHKFMIMDDDLKFSMRHPDDHRKLIPATPEHISRELHTISAALDWYPLIGIHPRAMGQEAPALWKADSRINATQAVNTDLIPRDLKLDHWPILADMVLNLSLLQRGAHTLVRTELFWDQYGGSNAPGGCSLHRTWEQQRDAVLGLKEMFPDLVTVKEKVTKNGWWGEDKPRTDFVIAWRKAYNDKQ